MSSQHTNKLVYYRHKFGYTQEEVISKLGLSSVSRLSNWEQGKSLPNLISLFKLCEIYNTTSEKLYPGLNRMIQRKKVEPVVLEVKRESTTEELLSEYASIIVGAYFSIKEKDHIKG